MTPKRSELSVHRLARLRADIRRRNAIAAAEHAIEIRDIAEAAIIRDRADLLAIAARIAEHAVGAREALRQNVFGEGGAFHLEQPLDEALRATVAGRERSHRKIASLKVSRDLLLDRGQSRRAQAATFRHVCSVARGPDRERHQVIDVRYDEML